MAKSIAGPEIERLIQLLAKAAAERNDQAIRDLLARNGVTFRVSAAPAAAPATVPAP